MAAKNVQNAVGVFMYPDGDADITVTGTHGTLVLNVSPNGPTLAIKDPERTKLLRGEHGAEMYKAVAALQANGRLHGWFVGKKGESGDRDTLVFFPARKTRARKQATKKAHKT